MLIQNGVSYSVIAVFITTLTMVGIITIPMEARYFGIENSAHEKRVKFLRSHHYRHGNFIDLEHPVKAFIKEQIANIAIYHRIPGFYPVLIRVRL